MPSVKIGTAQWQKLTQSQEKQTTVITPLGMTMLEIQGDLELPKDFSSLAQGDSHHEARFSKQDGKNVIRFGLLQLDGERATLFVGKKQRLLGKVTKLDVPVGIMHFNSSDNKVELVDVVKYKIIFKDRPLPIM
ncbi:Ctf8p [Saccharomyces eubayanus]|uniref:Ctf8p n=1 Tax=Saccharomyces eubayanus TaxID=1080349 RepID=UPI0006C2ED71|nr:CTF8-like protein [Saccharomyces eubayanus]KOG99249.1 CTF8-like protein [Saccharomyces eubayanus]